MLIGRPFGTLDWVITETVELLPKRLSGFTSKSFLDRINPEMSKSPSVMTFHPHFWKKKYFFFFFISWLVTNKHKKPFWYHGARVIVITDDDLDPYIVLQHPRRTLGEVEVGKIWWEDQDWNKKVKVDQISHMQYRLEMPHTHLLIITQTRQCHHIVGKQSYREF